MAVRYYFDADTLGLAKVVVRLRWDVTYPGDPGGTVKRHARPACPIATTDVDDTVWIPLVASEGWGIITRGANIERRPAELAAVADNGAKVFAISSKEKLDVGGSSRSSCAIGAASRGSRIPRDPSSTGSRERR